MKSLFAACLMMAAQTYNVPPAVLIGIHQVERGRIGQEVGPNSNGSYDLGPMQINTIWLPELAMHWGVDEQTARGWIRDDMCTNLGVAGWILRRKMDESGSLSLGIAHYHSRTPQYGHVYQNKVIDALTAAGLFRENETDANRTAPMSHGN